MNTIHNDSKTKQCAHAHTRRFLHRFTYTHTHAKMRWGEENSLRSWICHHQYKQRRHFKNDSNRLDSIQFRLPATASARAFQIPAILFRRLCHTHTHTHTKRGFSLLRYCRLVVTTLWRFDSRFVWFRGVFKFKPRLSIQCGFSGDLASYSNRRVRDFKSEFRNGANPHPLTTAFHYRFNF